MVSKKIIPYGDWETPITAEAVTSKSWVISAPRTCRKSGRAYFVESKDDERLSIVEITEDGLKDVLPSPYSAHNTVYEYGGSPYDVLPDGRIIFSNADNTVKLLDPDTAEVTDLVSVPTLRYSNFSTSSEGPWVLAVEEDHEHDTPDQIRNYVVAINADTGDVRRVVTGADFYYTPQFSPDGTRLAWLEWNQPDLPFAAAKLFWADWAPNGAVRNASLVCGEHREGVAEPRWGPDGTLYFGKEVDGFRQLHRIPPAGKTASQIELVGMEKAEFGEIRWFQGAQTYAPLSSKHLVAAAVIIGEVKLILVDLEASTWTKVGPPKLVEVMFDAMARLSDSAVLLVGSCTTSPQALYKIDALADLSTLVRGSTNEKFNESLYSEPEFVQFITQGSPTRNVNGILWMPRNPKFIAPEGDLPPLVILSHGGPTGYTGGGLKLQYQHFTTRGYAYFALNYTGSTGHGREYREALFGNWGILDADDAAEAAEYFIASGRVGKVGIIGGSAGGYNVLQSLVREPKVYSGGVCFCGVSDIKRLGESTHKLESRYIDALVLKPGMTEEEKEKIYRERSALFHASKIEAPLLLIHGTADTVVPVEQARLMARKIKDKGGVVTLVEVEGDGHMFGKPGSHLLLLREEEKWWRKMLLKK